MASAALSVSVVKSSQQPAEEAGPLGAEETNEEVDHSGDKDDARGDVVQVVESLLIGHHIQVPAGYNIQTNTHTHACTFRHNKQFPTLPSNTHAPIRLLLTLSQLSFPCIHTIQSYTSPASVLPFLYFNWKTKLRLLYDSKTLV